MENQPAKRKLNILVTILLAFNVLTLGALWYLYINDGKYESKADMRKRHIMDFMKNKMDFDEHQTKQLDILRGEHFRFKQMIQDSVRVLKKALVVEIMKEKTDSAAIQNLTKTIAGLLAENEMNFTMHFIKVKEICTPKQRTKLRQFLLEMAESAGKHGMAGHPPPAGTPPLP